VFLLLLNTFEISLFVVITTDMKVFLKLKFKDDDRDLSRGDAEPSGQISPRERTETTKKKEARLSLASPTPMQVTSASLRSTSKRKRKRATFASELPAPVETTNASPRSSAKKKKRKVTFVPDAYATPSDTDYAAECETRSSRLVSKSSSGLEEIPAPSALPTIIDPTVPWKDLLARINRPADPCDFTARAQPPSEPKCNKIYCIYTPHTFEELRPIFYSPYLESSELFEALSGHKVSPPSDLDEGDLDEDGWEERHEWWESTCQDPYIAFSNDLARDEILMARIFAQEGRKQWTRLEFGRAVWNFGQNYSGMYWLGINIEDRKRVRKVLARANTPDDDVESDGVDDGADVDAQGDGAWKPQRSRKVRR
jgi:hypothetical protein